MHFVNFVTLAAV